MVKKAEEHYDEKYYSWQRNIGEFGGWANLTKFAPFINPNDIVLDFGCGGGFLLKNIKCRKRIGIDVNPSAFDNARENGVELYRNTNEVPDDYVDTIISNNALEHTQNPLLELKSLYGKLKNSGKIILVVPCESISYVYRLNDINYHLYSWSPMSFGNLITEAGYELIESKAYIHKWPPKHQMLAKIGGRALFELACRIYGRIERSWFQVRAIARKSERDEL